jgi:tRNA A-37 threonylcarbamoyl transferase component Bud32
MTRKEERDPDPAESKPEAGSDTEAAALAETRVLSDEGRTEILREASTPPIAETPTARAAEAETRVLDASDEGVGPPVGSASRPSSSPEPPTPPAQRTPAPTSGTASAESGRIAPGTILFGEYEIVNVLGVGGMGEVYRARHRRLDEFRAIKVMHAELSKKKGASEFFHREAKALLAVRHPAVVHCHDLLSDEAGRVYLIMEMIEGIPLSKRMNDGPLSPDDVAILGARVSHGLSAAHRKGVIHRDVSPDNIVLPNGRVQEAKLIDFGIAKILQEGEGTIIDGFKGKLSYASPEQLGFFGGKIDGRSDFYSLGLVLIAAAQGRPMSMGTTVMEAVDARRGLASLPDEIPVGLRSAIAPLLALDPNDRPKYVDRLFVVPGGIEGGTDPGGYASAGVRNATSESATTSKAAIFAGVATAAAALVATGLYFLLGSGEQPEVIVDQSSPTSREAVAELESPRGADGTGTTSDLALTTSPAPTNGPGTPTSAKSAPAVRRISGSDRIKIIGLLSSAKLALAENQLMSPASDNAYDRYRRVLALDGANETAKKGLYVIADRYVGFTDAALAKGDVAAATGYLDRARAADATHPGISAAQSRLAR